MTTEYIPATLLALPTLGTNERSILVSAQRFVRGPGHLSGPTVIFYTPGETPEMQELCELSADDARRLAEALIRAADLT